MLDADSTFIEINAEYRNTCDYDINNDLDKAKRFVVACRFMLNPLFIQDEHRHAGESSRLTFERIQSQLDAALNFVSASSDNASNPIVSSFQNYRD